MSLDALKRHTPHLALHEFFRRHFGRRGMLRQARANFVESCAAYSVVCYLLQVCGWGCGWGCGVAVVRVLWCVLLAAGVAAVVVVDVVCGACFMCCLLDVCGCGEGGVVLLCATGCRCGCGWVVVWCVVCGVLLAAVVIVVGVLCVRRAS